MAEKVSSTSPGAKSVNNKSAASLEAEEDGSVSVGMWARMQVALSKIVLEGLTSLGCDQASGTGGSVGSCDDLGTKTDGLTSPFTMLSSIGHGLVNISTVMWVIGLTATTIAAATEQAAGVFNLLPGVGSWGAGFKAMTTYIVTSMMGAAAGIASMGFLLAYVLPFLPVIAWIMIGIGYLINTIEAMAAAPLAVIMLATPEGEGLSGGNMQKTIQLVNAIVLRPSLSIIGLFAAMALSYAAFAIVNDLFWRVASLQDGISVFGFLAILSLYISLCYRVVQAMIGLMAKIPNEILEWMAGGLAREFGSGADESIQRTGDFSGLNGEGGAKAFNAAKTSLDKARELKAKRSGKPGDDGGGETPPPATRTEF